MGIYQIANLNNNKIYIGSSINVYKRTKTHFNELKNGIHANIHLQNSFNKYHGNNFKFSILEYIEMKTELLSREQYWIDIYQSYDQNIGYNICKIAGNCLGKVSSDSHKRKNKLCSIW
jgi:group I intron endonuclease